MITAGIDIGSITAKAALFADKKIIATKVIFTGYNAEAAGLKVYEEVLKEAGIDKVEIMRSLNKIEITVSTAKPGLIIGRGGNGVEELKKKLHDKFLKNFRMGEINLNIKEASRSNLSAQIVVQSMILDIEKRMPFRKTIKQALEKVLASKEVKGVKIQVSGRLDGSQIARSEWIERGRLPRQTIRADIDYSLSEARCTYGTIGIKVWIYKGEKQLD